MNYKKAEIIFLIINSDLILDAIDKRGIKLVKFFLSLGLYNLTLF